MNLNWLFGGEGKPRAPVVVAFLVLMNALLLRYVDPPGVQRIRDFAFDTFQRIQPREVTEDLGVRIVDIDEAALEQFGQWPWPRNLIAELVDKLTKAGAAVIAFDIVFAERDRSSFSSIAKNLPAAVRDSDLRRMMEALPDNDEVLADVIARGNVVTGFAFDSNGKASPPRRDWGVVHNSGEKDMKSVGELIREFIPGQIGAVHSLDMLEQASKGNGAVTTEVEGGIVRRIPMLFRLVGGRDEDLYPALSLEALRVVLGASTYVVKWSGAQSALSFGERTGVAGIRLGDLDVDVDKYGRMALYDSGRIPERYISAADVLRKKVPAEKIKDHVIFIGTSAIGLKDLRYTPVQGAIPGVEIHAQLVEQIATKTFLERRDYADGAERLYLLAIGLIFILLLPRLSAARMATVAVAFIAIGLVVPWIAFSQFRLLFDPIYAPASLALIYVSGSALGFIRAERDRREIRGAFNLYLSPAQVEAVVRNPDLLALGGEQREITVMFTDVRGFTRISEQFDPQGLTRFMNRFLTPMSDLILGHDGTIDKYMGDAIMAFWNAPLAIERHAERACTTALAMGARLKDLNVEWEAEAKAEGRPHIPVNIGIGLNTGIASVGNFGSAQRLTYSCLSDEVNLASRLEGQCKTYVVGIIIGDNTCKQVPGMATIELDLIMVKGKTEPEHAHALVGDAKMAGSEAFRTLAERHSAFLGDYRAGRFGEALAAIGGCEQAAIAAGWSQGYYAMMRERIEGLIVEPPTDWNGVYVAKDK